MTIVQRLGKPDYFITITCNPNWKVIKENLFNNDSVINRPDIVAKVFHGKVKEFLNEVDKKSIFGRCIAYTYVIEFQKRGLSHMHMLLFVDQKSKIYNSDDVDKIISAEIPDKEQSPRLYGIVKQFMIHGPCGKDNMTSPCMDRETKKCTKNFPKAFNEKTDYNTTGYPIYRRRNDGKKIVFNEKSKRYADNRFVVPYNPYLLLKYNCHINVEVCSTVQCVKYLFKYCYEGHDCAMIKKTDNDYSVNNDGETENFDSDEIKQFLNTRYVSPPEAMYRLFKYPLNDISHVIYRLAVHLENEQYVYFKEGSEEELINKNLNTTLTAWFNLNQTDMEARQYLYPDIPNFYVFNENTKTWTMRKKNRKPVFSRMYLVNPRDRELFF